MDSNSKKSFWPLLIILCLVLTCGCAQQNPRKEKKIGACEDGWCELIYEGMPLQTSWKTTIASNDESGEPLIVSGTIYNSDGKTPAQGVVLYIHHTDHDGYYSLAPNQTTGIRHGRLRGWMITDAQGRYEFRTIRPAAYPGGTDPQHIHAIISEPGKGYYWIDDYLFEDDPLLTESQKARQDQRGGSGIMKQSKNSEGVWVGKRDIILGLNVKGY